MKVKANLKINPKAIKMIEEAAKKALLDTLEAMETEISNMQVVPKEIGNLEESIVVGVEEGKGYISYPGPYARRLYFNPQYDFRTDKNPNAQGRWLDPFMHGDKKYWLTKTFGEKLKENSGGVIK